MWLCSTLDGRHHHPRRRRLCHRVAGLQPFRLCVAQRGRFADEWALWRCRTPSQYLGHWRRAVGIAVAAYQPHQMIPTVQVSYNHYYYYKRSMDFIEHVNVGDKGTEHILCSSNAESLSLFLGILKRRTLGCFSSSCERREEKKKTKNNRLI